MHQEHSTELEYNSLPLGANRRNFAVFGNASEATILRKCSELSLNADQEMDVMDVWKRHPLKMTGDVLDLTHFQFLNFSQLFDCFQSHPQI